MICAFVQQQAPFPFAGETASLGAAFLWACCINVYRHHGRDIPPQVLNMLKNIVGVFFLILSVLLFCPLVLQNVALWGMQIRYGIFPEIFPVLGMLVLSGVIGLAIGDTAFFAALKKLGSQVSSAGLCLSPVFSVLIASIMLREVPLVHEAVGILTVIAALMGCIYFGRKEKRSPLALLSKKAFFMGVAFAVIAAIANGAGIVIAREALQEVHVLWGTLVRMAPALLVLFLIQHPDHFVLHYKERKKSFAVIAVASFFGTFLGVILLSVGTKFAKAGVASALTSTFPVWVIPISRIYGHEKTNWQSILCILCAVAGIVIIFLGDKI